MSQSTTAGASQATDATIAANVTTLTATTPLLGKRKYCPQEHPPTSVSASASPTNALVDAAFKRLFGYSWGTTFDLPINRNGKQDNNAKAPSLLERQMIQIFGPVRTARILNLPWDVVAPTSVGSNNASTGDSFNPAAMLTTKIVKASTDSTDSISIVSSSTEHLLRLSNSVTGRSKRMRLEEKDYKNIALPSYMVSANAKTAISTTSELSLAAAASTTKNVQASSSTTAIVPAVVSSSNLDNVLSHIAGKKQLNTVEKSSNDWEGFKETDKTLQDELERNAQSKNAYLVKKDFLNRVDHRKFELEKAERDRERSRRAAEG